MNNYDDVSKERVFTLKEMQEKVRAAVFSIWNNRAEYVTWSADGLAKAVCTALNSPEERVAVLRAPLGWHVLVDGKEDASFMYSAGWQKKQVDRYVAGLKEELAVQEKKTT